MALLPGNARAGRDLEAGYAWRTTSFTLLVASFLMVAALGFAGGIAFSSSASAQTPPQPTSGEHDEMHRMMDTGHGAMDAMMANPPEMMESMMDGSMDEIMRGATGENSGR